MQDPIFNQAYQTLKYVSQDPAARARYEAELKYELDFNTAIRSAQLKGKEEGKEEGKEKGKEKGKEEVKLEIAKNLKALGVSVETIAKATGLSTGQIDNL